MACNRVQLCLPIVLVLACHSREEKPAPAPAPSPAPVAAPAPAPQAPPNPFVQVPEGESVLSVLEVTDTSCRWLRRDPVAKKDAVVATFDGDCKLELAWSYDGRTAVVFRPDDDKLWTVAVETGTVKPLAAPEVGDLGRIGIDAKGTLHALTFDEADYVENNAPTVLTYQGTVIPVPDQYPGAAGLAHEYTLSPDGKWTHVGVKFSSSGGAGANVFPSAREFGPNTHAMHAAPPDGTELPDSPTRSLLQTFAGEPSEGTEWRQLKSIPPIAYARLEYDDEGYSDTNGAFLYDGKTVTALEPKEADFVAARGAHLLAMRTEEGTAKLYDLRTRAPVTVGDKVAQVAFWPQAAPARAMATKGP